jgi:hypothetical protein
MNTICVHFRPPGSSRTADVVHVGVPPGSGPPPASRRLRLLELLGDRSYLGMKPVESEKRSKIGKEHNREDVIKTGVSVEVEY